MDSGFYIILKKSGAARYIFAIETTKTAASAYPVASYEYTHWVLDCCGPLPAINHDSPWTDTRTYDMKRRSAYIMETDEAYAQYQGQVADGIPDATAKQIWLDARNSIRAKYPKP